MGNQISGNKTTINNTPNINKKQIDQLTNKKKYTNLISTDDLATAFKYYSIEGKYLNYDKFNESIKTLLKFDLPLLPYTYLSEKLFELMDKINEKYFIDDMKLVLTGTEARQRRLDEILDFFINSWLYGFRFVFYYIDTKFKDELISSGQYFPQKPQVLENMVYQNTESIRSYIISSLSIVGVTELSKGVDFELFKKWIAYDHTLEIAYANKRFRFAMNLMCLDDIGLTISN